MYLDGMEKELNGSEGHEDEEVDVTDNLGTMGIHVGEM